MKRPTLAHVRYVKKPNGKVYAYFNTGRRLPSGRPLYQSLPEPGSTGFFDAYAAMLGHRNKSAATQYTVAKLVDDYQRSREFKARPKGTQETYNATLSKVVYAWGNFPVDALDAPAIMEFMDGSAWGNGTRNLVRAVIGCIYSWGKLKGKCGSSPASVIPRLKTGEYAPWPESLLQSALTHEDQTIRLAVHLLAFTGQRIGDVCRMRWNDIADGRINVRQEKTGKELSIRLAEELRTELDRTPRTAITILAGVKPATLRRKIDGITSDYVPHGLRKNAVNMLLIAGSTVGEVAAITGQSWQMVEHYAKQIDTRRLGDAAIYKLDEHRKNRTKIAVGT